MAEHIECSLLEYHARSEWSHSQIETLITSPSLFHGRYITREFPREESKEFDIGTVAHAALLEPAGLDAVLAIIPRDALNEQGHRKGAKWLAWSAANEEKVQMKREEAAPIMHMVENVLAHKVGPWFAGDGETEFTITWEDAETGLKLRARPDRIFEAPAGLVLIDLKTTRAANPRKFINDAVEFGYHRQAAYYLDAAISYGMEPRGFVFVTVNKTPAHEVMAIQLPERAIEFGRQQNREALHELAWRLSENRWESRTANDIIELDLPEWAYKDQWRME